jgi:hypothetical protein
MARASGSTLMTSSAPAPSSPGPPSSGQGLAPSWRKRTEAHSRPRVPAVIWVSEPDSFADAVGFWNTRALVAATSRSTAPVSSRARR